MFQKTVLSLVIVSMLSPLAACGGREAQPVAVSQYGDMEKSCKTLRYEIQNLEQDIENILPKTDKTGKNVALGVAGLFLLVPWFFMDTKNAEATEYRALRQRHQNLTTIAMDKNCGIETQDYPSLEEMKQEYERQNQQQSNDDADGNN